MKKRSVSPEPEVKRTEFEPLPDQSTTPPTLDDVDNFVVEDDYEPLDDVNEVAETTPVAEPTPVEEPKKSSWDSQFKQTSNVVDDEEDSVDDGDSLFNITKPLMVEEEEVCFYFYCLQLEN